MEKITLWIKSAAGKISIFLMIMSIIILALACSSWGNFTEKTASNINNTLYYNKFGQESRTASPAFFPSRA